MPEERVNVLVSVAEIIQADVLSAINRAGGLITGIRKEGEASTAISATISRENLASFEVWLRHLTNGQGRISESPSE